MDCVGFYSNLWITGNGKQETNRNQTFSNGTMGKGGDLMVSTISLFHKPPFAEPVMLGVRIKSSSKHDCGKILGITSLFLGVTLVLMFMGPIMMVPDGSSEDELACNNKIIGFQQRGFYSRTEQYRLALTYCKGVA
jgi:hypothetical protein